MKARFPCSLIYCVMCEVAFVSMSVWDEYACVCLCVKMILLSISNEIFIMTAFFLCSANQEFIALRQDCNKKLHETI